MNEIIKREPTAVASYGERDPFEVYADSIRPGYIVGKLLKFSKGDYLLGEGAEPVEQGTVVVAAIDQLLIGSIRWENAKPAEHRMVRVASGQYPPLRHELGYLDRANWETDNDGKPRDPWQYSAYLPLLVRNRRFVDVQHVEPRRAWCDRQIEPRICQPPAQSAG